MAAGRHRKYGAVRQSGGRLDPENRRGRRSRVVISKITCELCGSARLRVAPQKAECEACRQQRLARSKRRADYRRSAGHLDVTALVRRRNTAAVLMRERADAWEGLGPQPLPHGLPVLDKLRASLDEVSVLDDELRQRFEAGVRKRPKQVPPEIAAFRRRLFADLRKGRRTVSGIQSGWDGLDAETRGLLEATHAFAVLSAQFGIYRTAAAFDRQQLALDVPLADALPRLPELLEGISPSSPEGEQVARATAADKAVHELERKEADRRRRLEAPTW